MKKMMEARTLEYKINKNIVLTKPRDKSLKMSAFANLINQRNEEEQHDYYISDQKRNSI